MNIALRNVHQSCMGTWWMHKNQIILKCQGRDQTHKNKHENHLRSHNFLTGSRRDFWLAAKYSLKKYPSEGCFPFYIRGAVLRHVTSQHYVFLQFFLTKINDGQGQRSRSKVKVSQNQYKSKIPYYPFITLQNRRFLQSILVTTVCYFAKS